MADMAVSELKQALADAETREEALLSRLCLLESAYMEIEKELVRAQGTNGGSTARPRSSQRRFSRPAPRLPRSVGAGEDADDPPGLVLVAGRLAREGHSRDDVERFLQENFCVTDIANTVATAFAELSEPTSASA
jgi:hypothetical protein